MAALRMQAAHVCALASDNIMIWPASQQFAFVVLWNHGPYMGLASSTGGTLNILRCQGPLQCSTQHRNQKHDGIGSPPTAPQLHSSRYATLLRATIPGRSHVGRQ
jgi:hypothetical protein